MCGKSVVPKTRTYHEIEHKYGVSRAVIRNEWTGRTAIPGDNIHVLFDWKGETCLVDMHWGFRGVDLYNARSDSLDKPTWAQSFATNRCVFPAKSFVEGSRTFTDPEGSELCIAGIWGVMPQTKVFCVSLITTKANPLVEPAHARMPLLMPEEGVLDWISPRYHNRAAPLLGEFTEYSREALLVTAAAA